MKHNNEQKAGNIFEMITARVTEQLEKGIVPWHQPWVGGAALAVSFRSGKPYSMLNQMLLGKPGEWLTWNEIQAAGGKVRKGAKSAFCVWTKVVEDRKEEDGTEKKEDALTLRRYLKWFRVFHISDTEGIESKIPPVKANPDLNPIAEAEAIIDGYLSREKGLRFECEKESAEAYYSPSQDKVVIPCLSQYEVVEEYYSTAFHELTHSTMHEKRCNRRETGKVAAFGSKDYSREELVAEMGAAMLVNRAGIESKKSFDNSVAYIGNWLKALQNDKNMVVYAAARAEKAAKYILNEQN